MLNGTQFAQREMEILSASLPDPDNRPLIEPFKDEILALVEKFHESGQSGGSAPFTAGAIAEAVKSLCLWMPIAPVTGDDDEWVEVTTDGAGIFQNKRCSAVFKEGDEAYYLDAIVWRTPNGVGYTGNALLPTGGQVSSRQNITFPFQPKTFYVDVDEREIAPGDWEHTVKDPTQLAAVFELYQQRSVAIAGDA